MYGIEEDLSEEYILKYLSQEEIFAHFLNIDVKINDLFCSPLRQDDHPTCNFNWFNGKLWFRDWSEASPKDCFQIVKDLYNCNFHEALQIIKREMLVDSSSKVVRKKTEKELKPVNVKKSKSIIQTQITKWQAEVITYLKQYGITSAICQEFNVFPINRVWLNKQLIWTYTPKDPAIGYFLGKTETGEERWKIYFFRRSTYRFLCNTNRIYGWVQIPKQGKDLIITKSLKDVMALKRLGYDSIAMQNETTEPYDYIIEELQSRFTQLWSFYDYDRPGRELAGMLEQKYNIPSIFLKDTSKDISDYIKDTDLETAQQFLDSIIPPF
jgi:hypothetical protein